MRGKVQGIRCKEKRLIDSPVEYLTRCDFSIVNIGVAFSPE